MSYFLLSIKLSFRAKSMGFDLNYFDYSLFFPGLSAALLVVMGSRFKRSGKIFPAGVVSLVSLVMTGGYLHGILRSTH